MAKQSAYLRVEKPLTDKERGKAKEALAAIPGVLSVAVGKGGDRVSVDYDSTGTASEEFAKTLQSIGFEAVTERVQEHLM